MVLLDLTLDIDDYVGYLSGRFHTHVQQDCSPREYAQRCLDLVLNAKGVTYLCDSAVTIDGITIHGSPWTQPSNKCKCSTCVVWRYVYLTACIVIVTARHMAFQKFELDEQWNRIPTGTDVVVTHGPPLCTGDLTVKQHHCGDAQLLYHLEDRVQPRVHICGTNIYSLACSSVNICDL